jgi:hypothetical protein
MRTCAPFSVGAIDPVGITNASASNARNSSASVKATTIDSIVSRPPASGSRTWERPPPGAARPILRRRDRLEEPATHFFAAFFGANADASFFATGFAGAFGFGLVTGFAVVVVLTRWSWVITIFATLLT